MSTLSDAIVWLNDPQNWQGTDGVPHRVSEQLAITAIAVGVGALVALPVAFLMGHRGRGGGAVVVLSNLSRAVPTYGLLVLFAGTSVGFGNPAATVALVFFAVPPLLANAFTGIRGVDRDVLEAARGMGLSELQVLLRVEVPLALPLIVAGVRTAAVQVIATAPLSALVGGGTLGVVIRSGFGTQRYGQVVAGGILVALLALLTEAVLLGVQRLVTLRGRPTLLRSRTQRKREAVLNP